MNSLLIEAPPPARLADDTSASRGRLVYLDVLRFVAIGLVLGFHQPAPIPHGRWWSVPLEIVGHCGWAGVNLFFVLSGFLIGGLLLAEHERTGGIDLRRFYLRRAFRIWPAYLLFLAMSFAFTARTSHTRGPDQWRELALSYVPRLLHVQNYFAPLTHLWSLSVEEHFYLVIPVMLVFLGWRTGRVRLLPLAIIYSLAVVGCLLGRALSDPHLLVQTQYQIDSLLAGVMLAYLFHRRPALIEPLRARRAWLLLPGIASFVPAALLEVGSHRIVYTLGVTLLAVGSACLVLWATFASQSDPTPRLPWRVMAWIGACSYSIYLFHLPFAQWLPQMLARRLHWPIGSVGTYWAIFSIYLVLAVAAGRAVFIWVEEPMLMLRDRVFPSHTSRHRP